MSNFNVYFVHNLNNISDILISIKFIMQNKTIENDCKFQNMSKQNSFYLIFHNSFIPRLTLLQVQFALIYISIYFFKSKYSQHLQAAVSSSSFSRSFCLRFQPWIPEPWPDPREQTSAPSPSSQPCGQPVITS